MILPQLKGRQYIRANANLLFSPLHWMHSLTIQLRCFTSAPLITKLKTDEKCERGACNLLPAGAKAARALNCLPGQILAICALLQHHQHYCSGSVSTAAHLDSTRSSMKSAPKWIIDIETWIINNVPHGPWLPSRARIVGLSLVNIGARARFKISWKRFDWKGSGRRLPRHRARGHK